MYQFDAVGSPTASYSNFTTKLIIFGELTVFTLIFLFKVGFQPGLFYLVSLCSTAYSQQFGGLCDIAAGPGQCVSNSFAFRLWGHGGAWSRECPARSG